MSTELDSGELYPGEDEYLGLTAEQREDDRLDAASSLAVDRMETSVTDPARDVETAAGPLTTDELRRLAQSEHVGTSMQCPIDMQPRPCTTARWLATLAEAALERREVRAAATAIRELIAADWPDEAGRLRSIDAMLAAILADREQEGG